jgi:hypothetical protein
VRKQGLANDQTLPMRVGHVRKITPGVTESSRARVHIDPAACFLDVGSSYPGGALAPKGKAVRLLKFRKRPLFPEVKYLDAIISKDMSIDFPKFPIGLLEFLTDDIRIRNPPSDLVQLVSNQWGGTQAALARELSISASRLGHYLKRRRDIPLGVLKRLLETLNIDPSSIGAQSLCVRASASASKPVCIPNYINPRIAYILGAIHDGCLWQKGNQFMIIVWQEKK